MPKPTNITSCLAVREFTDREEPQKAFLDLLDKDKDYRVLHFYGIGGIGKSSLQKHLMSFHLDSMDGAIYSHVDFDNASHRDSAVALQVLAERFRRKFKVVFPLFEACFVIYWAKNNPEIKLNKDKELPFVEEGSILADAVGILDNGITGFAMNSINYIYKKFSNRVSKEYKEDLESLIQTNNISLIKSRLAVYFAKDLKNHLEENSIKKSVIFMDTYEALKSDIWIYEEFANNLSKEVMLVTSGREKLRWSQDWDEYIEQHLVGDLSAKDCAYFLKSCSIKDNSIIEAITKGSKGVPYYLDLCVDIYQKSENPKVEDFDIEQKKIFERFVKYLDRQEIETLKLLAHLRCYTKELFSLLLEEFKIYFPMTSFSDFNSYSFIQREDNRYFLHDLMRESLLKITNKELSKKVSEHLLEFYEKEFKELELEDLKDRDTQKLKEAFEEALYQKERLSSIIELSSWINRYGELFIYGAKYDFLYDSLKKLVELLKDAEDESEKIEFATSCNNLALLYRNKAEYEKAEPLYIKALETRENVLGKKHLDTAESYNDLAENYRGKGEYKKAEPLFFKALEIRENVLGKKHLDTAKSYNDLAVLYWGEGEYEKAEPLYFKALEICKKVLGENHPDTATSYNNLAVLYRIKGEYGKAEPLYIKALEIREKVLGENHPYTVISYATLAVLYNDKEEYGKAEPLYFKSLETFKKVLGENHPYTSVSYHNLGEFYDKRKEYKKAYEYMQKAVKIREKVLPENHPDLKDSKSWLGNIKRRLEGSGK